MTDHLRTAQAPAPAWTRPISTHWKSLAPRHAWWLLALPLLAGLLKPERAHFGRAAMILVLVRRVLWDILLSNIEVARRILGPERALTPAFVWLPLDLTNIHAITALASIITLTPGTVSAELSDDRRHLLIHCFNLGDADRLRATIKARYEAPLKEIFR